VVRLGFRFLDRKGGEGRFRQPSAVVNLLSVEGLFKSKSILIKIKVFYSVGSAMKGFGPLYLCYRLCERMRAKAYSEKRRQAENGIAPILRTIVKTLSFCE